MEAVKRKPDNMPLLASPAQLVPSGDSERSIDRVEATHAHFLLHAREHVNSLLVEDKGVTTVALATVSLLQQILFRESRSVSIDEAMEEIFRTFAAGSVISRTFRDLYRSANGALIASKEKDGSRNIDSSAIISDLREIIEWYGVRKSSLIKIQERELRGQGIFRFDILPDRTKSGALGLEVSAGLVVEPSHQEDLWWKVFIYDDRSVVLPREGWGSWIDHTDGMHILDDQGDFHAVSAIVPIHAPSERVILDDVRVFFPYAALDLPSGRQELTVVGGLFNSDGEQLLSLFDTELVTVPRNSAEIVPFPSPQAIGLWQRCPVTQDAISISSIDSQIAGSGRYTLLNIRMDCALFGHQDEVATVECRLLTQQGEIVASRNAASLTRQEGDRFGGFVTSLKIYPSRPITRFIDLQFQIPSTSLDLTSGMHDLFCELSVLQQDNRILCGVISPFQFRVF